MPVMPEPLPKPKPKPKFLLSNWVAQNCKFAQDQSDVITLTTKAKDNRGKEYPVQIRREAPRQEGLSARWIFEIVGTPGKWYVHTLLKDRPEALAIHGLNWGCINMRELLDEAESRLNEMHGWRTQ